MDELGIDHAVLAGYDIGSRVAQLVAHDHPERVVRLVVAPPLPGIGHRILGLSSVAEFWYQNFHQLDLATDLIDGQPDAVRRYLRHFWCHWSGPDFALPEGHLDHLAEVYARPGAFTASISWYRAGAAALARSVHESAPATRMSTSTTVLWPEFDPLFPRSWSDRLDEWFSDVDLVPLDGVGHFVPVEAPEAFALALRQSLGQAP
jgi:pimeloyl-ACP methyl ester carboxylesterase